MKLTMFSEQTLPKLAGGWKNASAKISFAKTGVIHFNPQACDLLKLKGGDKISLGQDPEHPENWYIFKDKENGFPVRSGYKGRGAMFNHRVLIETVLDCFGLDGGRSYGYKIGGQPTKIDKVEYWGILIMTPVTE